MTAAAARDFQTTQNLHPTTDPNAIGESWDAITEPGLVYEARVLCKGRNGPLGLRETVSGFFNNRQAFIEAVRRISGDDAAGVYLTLNPVDPALFTRSPNRLASGPIKATRDENIIGRRRFLIDIDAANGPDSSATGAERAAALARRDDIHIYLQDVMGWGPARIVTCSGNGGGLVFAIDLPNDDQARDLIKRALQALHAQFTTPAAKVDISISNASRITRTSGTVTAKGTPTLERPWRRATATYPDGAGIVTRAQLEALAATLPTKTRTARANGAATTAASADERTWYADRLANGSPAGQRHHDMTRLVGHYLALGIAPAEVRILLRPWVDRCTPSFPYEELDSTIRDLAAAEARKQTRCADAPEREDAPRTMSVSELLALVATQRAELADWKAQAKAWEHLFTNRALPDKAKRVLVHMHKRLGVTVGRAVPDTKPRALFPEAQDLQAEGLVMTAYKEGLDVLLSLDIVTRQQVMKKVPAPEPGAEIGARRARARGKDWYYKYGLNGPTVNALWNQLPTLTDIAPTERQLKVKQSREECLQKAIAEEKPSLDVVRALKREVAEVRQDHQNVVFEYRAVTQERDNARSLADAAARDRDQALENAQRVIREHQQPAVMLGCKGCGQRIDLDTWRCDDCRAQERADACDSKSDVDLESNAPQPVPLLTGQHPTLNSPAPVGAIKKPCYGGCGTLTTNGYTCKQCRERPIGVLHIPDSTLTTQEVAHGL